MAVAAGLLVTLTGVPLASAGERGSGHIPGPASVVASFEQYRMPLAAKIQPRSGRGGYLAVWAEHGAGTRGVRIRMRRLDGQGAPSGETTAIAIEGSPDDPVTLASLDVGYDRAHDRFLVLYSLWRSESNEYSDMFAQQVDPAGTPLGTPATWPLAVQPGEISFPARLVSAPRGSGFLLVHRETDWRPPTSRAYIRRLAHDGRPGRPRPLDVPSADLCDLASNPRRRELLLACTHHWQSGTVAVTRRLRPSGAPAGPAVRVARMRGYSALPPGIGVNTRTGAYGLAASNGRRVSIHPLDGRGRPRGRGPSFRPPTSHPQTTAASLVYDRRSATFLATWGVADDLGSRGYFVEGRTQLLTADARRPLGRTMHLPSDAAGYEADGSSQAASDARARGFLTLWHGFEQDRSRRALVVQHLRVR